MIRLALLALGTMVVGCATPIVSKGKAASVAPGQVILVGRLSINKKPPKSTNVIDVLGLTEGALVRASTGTPSDEVSMRSEGFRATDFVAPWDKLFFIPYAKASRIYVNGIYVFVYSKTGMQEFVFPVAGHVPVPEGAKHVYIGHIYLTVDEFYGMKLVTVKDEYEKDSGAMTRKSLLRVR